MFVRATDRHNYPSVEGATVCAVAFFWLVVLSTSAPFALAQGVPTSPLMAQSSTKLPSAGAQTPKSGPISSKPEWKDLTSAQQLSLKPLEANWNTLDEAKKRKWIAISANYPSLAPAEQVKLHSRMAEWVSLSPQQRDQARLNFAQSKRLTPTEKAANWQAYQALSPEEKQKLAISAPPKPAGAAAAAKPVPPQKLAVVPVTRQTPKQTPKISPENHTVNRNTLLPRALPSGEPVSPKKN